MANLRARPVRFLATFLAIVVGTGFLAGTMVLSDSLGPATKANAVVALKGVDAAVEPPLGTPTLRVRGRNRSLSTSSLPASLLAQVQGTARRQSGRRHPQRHPRRDPRDQEGAQVGHGLTRRRGARARARTSSSRDAPLEGRRDHRRPAVGRQPRMAPRELARAGHGHRRAPCHGRRDHPLRQRARLQHARRHRREPGRTRSPSSTAARPPTTRSTSRPTPGTTEPPSPQPCSNASAPVHRADGRRSPQGGGRRGSRHRQRARHRCSRSSPTWRCSSASSSSTTPSRSWSPSGSASSPCCGPSGPRGKQLGWAVRARGAGRRRRGQRDRHAGRDRPVPALRQGRVPSSPTWSAPVRSRSTCTPTGWSRSWW